MANFHSVKNKQVELQAYLTLNKVDIILGTESYLDDSITNPEIFPVYYQVYHKDIHSGGVLMIIFHQNG